MILNVLQYPDPKLFELSKDVTRFDSDVAILINNMIETCKKTDNCVGLAAIQVGIPLRLSVIKIDNKYIHIINPQIINFSDNKDAEWEGCMSIGIAENQLFSRIKRYSKISVTYYNKKRMLIKKQYTGFTAHAFQHEVDHMNGILFLKHVEDPSKIWKDKDLNEYIKKYNSLPV